MINLPKPSLFKSGSVEDIYNYLIKLVPAIEKSFMGNKNTATEQEPCVRDIGYKDNSLVITYTNGNVKTIELE